MQNLVVESDDAALRVTLQYVVIRSQQQRVAQFTREVAP